MKKTFGFKILKPQTGYTVDLKNIKNLNLHVLSDIHVGAKECAIDKLKLVINKIASDPNSYVVLNGDNIEFIPPAYGISERGQELYNDDQVLSLVGLVEPIAHKILFIRGGNHDTERSINIAGCDVTKIIAERLSVPYYELPGYMTIKLKHRNLVIVSGHGFSGGANGDTELLRLKRAFPNGDVYVLGHNHQLYVKRDDSLFLDPKGGEAYKEAWIGRAGSFLGYAEYSRKRIMIPQPVGYLIVSVEGESLSCSAKIL